MVERVGFAYSPLLEAVLSLHVLAAVLVVGPITVAASLFPRYARQVTWGDEEGRPALRLLHRTTRVYAVLGLAVPALGLATAVELEVLTDAWLLTSVALTALAAGVLGLVVLPAQSRVLEVVAEGEPIETSLRRLAMATGAFAVLWAVVVVLMIVRPGSTTGA